MLSMRKAVPFVTLTLGIAGAATAAEQESNLSGGITLTALAAEGGRASPTGAGSFDLVLDRAMGNGAWVVYLEGSTAVNPGTVSALYPSANADAGTAQVNNNNGAVQISELKYRWDGAPGGALTIGMLDTAGYIDLSGTANDENAQFLNGMLVNNAAIALPDYTVGFAYESENFFALVTGSHGLADNDKKSYSQLFQLGEAGKGIFGAAGLRYKSGSWSTELGGWSSTAKHDNLEGTRSDLSNNGYYAVFGGAWDDNGFDLRLGSANPDVNSADRFASLSSAFGLGDGIITGAGYAYHALAEKAKADGLGDTRVAEIYVRFAGSAWETTIDLQHLQNPEFDATAPATFVGGIRLHRAF